MQYLVNMYAFAVTKVYTAQVQMLFPASPYPRIFPFNETTPAYVFAKWKVYSNVLKWLFTVYVEDQIHCEREGNISHCTADASPVVILIQSPVRSLLCLSCLLNHSSIWTKELKCFHCMSVPLCPNRVVTQKRKNVIGLLTLLYIDITHNKQVSMKTNHQ